MNFEALHDQVSFIISKLLYRQLIIWSRIAIRSGQSIVPGPLDMLYRYLGISGCSIGLRRLQLFLQEHVLGPQRLALLLELIKCFLESLFLLQLSHKLFRLDLQNLANRCQSTTQTQNFPWLLGPRANEFDCWPSLLQQ